MSVNDEYVRIIGAVLRAADPVAALARRRADEALSPQLRAILAGLSPDGLRMARLLVLQLRFNRLLNGSSAAAADFSQDPQGFSSTFERYHREVPPTAEDPVAEARLYAAWLSADGRSGSG